MKKGRLGIIGTAMMLAAAVATPGSMAQVNQAAPQQTEQTNNKATKPEVKKRNQKTVFQSGGLSVEGLIDYGRSPKEYGLNYGAKKHGKKSNKLRYSHNAKLKRR